MMRYLRLYLYFVQFSFSKAMEFRVDFFFRIVMDVIFYTVQFFFFGIIYKHTNLLGGWDLEQTNMFIAAFIFADAFHMTVFANNSWFFPISINQGKLDYYLTKPVSSFFFLAFKELAANSFLNLVLAIGILSYFLNALTISLASWKVLVFILLLIHGAFLYFMIYLLFLIPVFWTGSDRGFADMFYAAEKIMHRPDGIFTGFIRRFFLSILPFSLIASFPIRFLFTTTEHISILTEIFIGSSIVYLAVFILWRLGLRNYSSASS